MKNLKCMLTVFILVAAVSQSLAQHNNEHPKLHVNPQWDECSFELNPALTQKAWRQFTKEAALVAYFRPLKEAKPMGQWHVEFSVLQWATAIDDKDAAWNDTFVHPDSTHWLTNGPRLAFPGLTARIGITNRLDVGVYFTKNPNANYGFWGAQVQYNLINKVESSWAVSTRASFVSMFGPDDLTFNIYGADVIASKEFKLFSDWAYVSPYVGLSTYVSHAHERTEAVKLDDEIVGGGQVMAGAVLRLSIATLGVEYNVAKVSTLSFKIGVSF
jgi:hypothetical protein